MPSISCSFTVIYCSRPYLFCLTSIVCSPIGPTSSPDVAKTSSITVVTVLSVLLAIVVIVIIIVGYITYRRYYKNKLTETADFRFVDLSDNTSCWQRFRMRCTQCTDNFRRSRTDETTGLVKFNVTSYTDDPKTFYSTKTVTAFPHHESL